MKVRIKKEPKARRVSVDGISCARLSSKPGGDLAFYKYVTQEIVEAVVDFVSFVDRKPPRAVRFLPARKR